MNVFEDAGYFCVDNLPPEMIRALVELFVHEGSKVERAAVVSDVRGGDYFEALRAVLEDLEALGAAPPRALPRTRPTTRSSRASRRPAGAIRWPRASTVERGIALERAVLEPIKGLADVVIDSTGLTAHMLRRRIADEFLPRVPAVQARRVAGVLRLQARPGARRRHGPRRALPAQPALRARPAPADRPRPARRRLRRPRRSARGLLRAPGAPAGLPAAPVRDRGQGAPDDRRRLHRRAPPLRGRSPSTSRAAGAGATTSSSRSSTATSRTPTHATATAAPPEPARCGLTCRRPGPIVGWSNDQLV